MIRRIVVTLAGMLALVLGGGSVAALAPLWVLESEPSCCDGRMAVTVTL